MIPKSRSNHEKQLQVEPDTMIRAYSMVDILCNIVFKFRVNQAFHGQLLEIDEGNHSHYY